VRIGLVAGALVLLAAGYSHSNQAAEGPYSSADVVWLARFAGWDDEYSRQVQQVSATFRDVLGSRQAIAALREAVAPMRDCADSLKGDVRRPESERLRRAYARRRKAGETSRARCG